MPWRPNTSIAGQYQLREWQPASKYIRKNARGRKYIVLGCSKGAADLQEALTMDGVADSGGGIRFRAWQ
jgi:hypothetical protein